ncbi:MAG: cytochrome P460 family protein [Deltaproteobacteria bacterium]|nr:cytochrome P460 family protein [Deltaproteobacteria bacterium]
MLAVAAEKGKDAMPAAAGKDLWAYLSKVKYQQKFALWPGKEKLYKGTEPHGALLTTYVNKSALGAIKGKKGTMPAGAIVVKENYMPDKKLDAITVMYKVKGFNPEGGDWFWAKYAPDGMVQAEGKTGMAEMCIGCHGKVKGNDFLYTGQLK